MQKDLTAKQKNTFKTIEKLSQVQVNINRTGCTTKRKIKQGEYLGLSEFLSKPIYVPLIKSFSFYLLQTGI